MRKYITKASERIGVESTSRDGKRAQVVIEQNRCAMACQGCGAAFFFSIIKWAMAILTSI